MPTTTYVSSSGGSQTGGTLDTNLQPDGSVDPASGTYYSLNGTVTLQSLFIGPSIEVDIGDGFLTTGSLIGTGAITGANDTSGPTTPLVSNPGSSVDINGMIAVTFYNYGQLSVSAGERLDIEGDLFSLGASVITVAAGAELDLNSENTANVSSVTSNGTLRVTAPTAALAGDTTLAGAVIVQGDALNAAGSGTAAARDIGTPNGAYVATLDLRGANLLVPINSLTLGQDAQIRFGSGDTTLKRFIVAGSPTALSARDVVDIDGTVAVTGDGSGSANQVSVSQAEFDGGTISFAVAASDGGASLQNQVVVGAGTTLRNDGSMTLGVLASAAGITTLGAATGGTGSLFVNGAGASLTIGYGASLGVAALQNAGAITVAANATFAQPFTNTGTVDVTFGTLSLAAATSGSGAIAVENGAVLSIGAATSDNVLLRTGGLLRLSQPSSFTGTIQMPAVGAQIDLSGITATAVAVSGNSIVVTSAAGNVSLAQTGLTSANALSFAADGAGGSLITVNATVSAGGASTPAAPTTPTPPALPNPAAYRFFDSVNGTQFLTTSLTETQTIQATRPDLVYEGIGLITVNPLAADAAPVYRFFDTRFGTHFYTSSTTERNDILNTRPDLVSEGIGFYEHTSQEFGDVPVYRFFDSNLGTHFYTASATERATVIATRPDLVPEGIGFYAPTS